MIDQKVAVASDEQCCAIHRAAICRTLVAGTEAMRKARETYLPKEEAESDAAYIARVKRSTLFNAFGKTVADMTGKVFDRPVLLKEDVPTEIQAWCEDIDSAGRHINVFARDVFFDALQPGIGFVLVDMPPAVTRADGTPATLADEKTAGIRPYLVYIPLEKVLGWKSTTINGAEVLTQVRIKECVSEESGEFSESEVEQIKVIDAAAVSGVGRWRTFRKATDGANTGKWVLYEEGTYNLPVIPLVPVYLNRTGFMTGEPPLEKLAEKNVEHWQSASDQRNILHVARVPILFGSGFKEDEAFTIGAGSMVRATSENAKLVWVEHSGQAIEAGRNDLKDLELQMQAMGLQLLIPQPGGHKTATGVIQDTVKENSPLAMMATALGDALEAALAFMAQFAKLGDTGGEVDVNTDFGVQGGASTDVQYLTVAATAGDISRETYWEELKRRNILSDSFDPDTEKQRIADEAPKLDAGPGNGLDLNAGPGA